MSEQTIDLKKRRFLTNATGVVGAVGVGFVAWPFLSTWKPSAKTKAAGAPVDVDISKLESGQLVRVLWRKKPVWIFKRDKSALDALNSKDLISKLDDPSGTGNSKNQQPDYVTPNYRSIENKESVAVIVGVCTHLGCAPKFYPEIQPQPWDDSWIGGFFCPCHGSMFDIVGRVFKGVPAPTNLKVPPHYFDGSILTIGEER